jgi:iron complex transport system permease protein
MTGFFLFKICNRAQRHPILSLIGTLSSNPSPRFLQQSSIGESFRCREQPFRPCSQSYCFSGLFGVLPGHLRCCNGYGLFNNWFLVQASSSSSFCRRYHSVGMASCIKGNTVLLLVLGGVISGGLFMSFSRSSNTFAYNQLPAITTWLMGRLSLTDMHTTGYHRIPSRSMCTVILMSGYLMS